MLRDLWQALFGDTPPRKPPPPAEDVSGVVEAKRATYRNLRALAIKEGDTDLLEYAKRKDAALDDLVEEHRRMQREYDVYRSER